MMNVTDHTLGVIFGIVRGIVVMGVFYWVALWYYSDAPELPRWIADARTRPIMQLTAIKLDKWFLPGGENKLLQRDIVGSREAIDKEFQSGNPALIFSLVGALCLGGYLMQIMYSSSNDGKKRRFQSSRENRQSFFGAVS